MGDRTEKAPARRSASSEVRLERGRERIPAVEFESAPGGDDSPRVWSRSDGEIASGSDGGAAG